MDLHLFSHQHERHAAPGWVDDASAPRPELGVVLGGGALWGIGYGLGVVRGLREVGIEVAGAPILGTSAGSWVAAAVQLGTPVEAFLEIPVRVPDPRAGKLLEWSTQAFGDARSPLVRATSWRIPRLASWPAGSGPRWRRPGPVVLDGARSPLAELAAASSAIPGVFASVRLGRSTYFDGGLRGSPTNADLGPRADHLLVVAPLASGALPFLGRAAAIELDVELDRWRAANPGGQVTVIRPDVAVSATARTPLDLFDLSRSVAAEEAAAAQIHRLEHAGALRRVPRRPAEVVAAG